MSELADEADSKSAVRNDVWVQAPLPVPFLFTEIRRSIVRVKLSDLKQCFLTLIQLNEADKICIDTEGILTEVLADVLSVSCRGVIADELTVRVADSMNITFDFKNSTCQTNMGTYSLRDLDMPIKFFNDLAMCKSESDFTNLDERWRDDLRHAVVFGVAEDSLYYSTLFDILIETLGDIDIVA